MSQLLGSAEATLNGGSAGAELPVCSKNETQIKINKTIIKKYIYGMDSTV